MIVDTDTMDVQSIPFKNYKKHIEVELTASNITEALKIARSAKESGDHVKIIMKEVVDLSEVKGEFNVVDKTEQDITARGITSSMSIKDKFQKYMDIKDIPEDKRENYFQLATEIVDEIEA